MERQGKGHVCMRQQIPTYNPPPLALGSRTQSSEVQDCTATIAHGKQRACPNRRKAWGEFS
eukprot:2623025-Pleurochrysis_carterae.AAC.2